MKLLKELQHTWSSIAIINPIAWIKAFNCPFYQESLRWTYPEMSVSIEISICNRKKKKRNFIIPVNHFYNYSTTQWILYSSQSVHSPHHDSSASIVFPKAARTPVGMEGHSCVTPLFRNISPCSSLCASLWASAEKFSWAGGGYIWTNGSNYLSWVKTCS